MIQSASYLVCLGKREKKKIKKKKREKRKKKSVRKKREKKKKLDLSRLNLVVEFGLESVLCTV